MTELRSFVGLASYYRDHIRSFASIARPLHVLTRKGARFEWTETQETAFNQLKDLLTSAPVLSAPMDTGTFILDADSSNEAVGVVLQQVQDGKERVIAYASRCLDNAERSYCTTRKELLAVIYGLKKYRQFRLARSFIIRADHAALTHLLRTPEPVAQQARWIDLLAEFHFDIRHRPGLVHSNSDALSRRPCERDGQVECRQCRPSSARRGRVGRVKTRGEAAREQSNIERQQASMEATVGPAITESSVESSRIRQEQLDDVAIGFILRCLEQSKDQPEWDLVADQSDEIRTYRAQWASHTVHEGILYRHFYSGDGSTKFLQLIVPASMREEFVRQAHDGITGGHFGVRRTADQVLRRGYWCGWRRYVEEFCRRCSVCSQVHRGQPPRQGLLHPLRENGPMDRPHIDLCGPFPRSKGCSWILTCIDAYTRYLVATPLPDKSAATVAETLVKDVFCKVGCSRQLVSDLGKEFQNEVMQHLCRMLDINQLRTTSYKPSSNGRIERVHRSLNSLMAKLVSDTQRDWVRHLPACVMAYNVSKHESTSFSPYFLMHGREAICPLDLVV
ncbi:MAG TPA: RNase H-like domain-containing protein, partial [Methylomicrobium sp.]|nr:RNase H-like domain-containing protein [Methylomicrobium sp.]